MNNHPLVQASAIQNSMLYPILVVDDDYHLCKTIQLMLEEEGFAVQIAADGQEAVDLRYRRPHPRSPTISLTTITFFIFLYSALAVLHSAHRRQVHLIQGASHFFDRENVRRTAQVGTAVHPDNYPLLILEAPNQECTRFTTDFVGTGWCRATQLTQSHCNPVLFPYQNAPSLGATSGFCSVPLLATPWPEMWVIVSVHLCP